ncbi:MAG: 2OG-Fe(II) oxygenase family protein [Pseudomonadota bacterium]
MPDVVPETRTTAPRANAVSADRIPVVDITALRDDSDPVGVARALHAASRDLGFIYVSGHGIPRDVIEQARAAAYGFFRSDAANRVRVAVSQHHRGWIATGGAVMADGVKPDLKESFVWGIEPAADDGHPLRGSNQWPDSPAAFRAASLAYFAAADRVARHLMRGFALGLSLPDDFFLRQCAQPLSRASYVYYPPQADGDHRQFGVGPHTDFGVLTVLCQDDVGGLEVQDTGGRWLKAPPIEGTLVVNVADLLSRWTDGYYTSTPHRVVNRSGRERLSLVLAWDPDPDTPIDSRAVFGEAHTPSQPPITCGDYLVWRFGQAFAHRT